MAQKEQANSALKLKKAEALFHLLEKKSPRVLSRKFYDSVRDTFTFSKSETDGLIQYLIDDNKVSVNIDEYGFLAVSLN